MPSDWWTWGSFPSTRFVLSMFPFWFTHMHHLRRSELSWGHACHSSSVFFFFYFHFSCFCLAESSLSMTYSPLGKLKKEKNKQTKESEADESPSASRQKQNRLFTTEVGFGMRALGACREIFIKAAWEDFFISLRGISTHSHLGAAQFNHSCALLGADSYTGANWKLNQQPLSAKVLTH